MEKVFRPEFLNRVDDIIVFRGLSEKDLHQIVDIELAKVAKRLKEKGFTLQMTDEAKKVLIEKGTNTEYGARPLRRAIENLLEDPLAEDLLRGTFVGADTIIVKADGAGEDAKLIMEGTKSAAKQSTAEPVAAK
jgi:ATP-dependent Clp protease ATP-binding subunit ClpC